MFTKAILIISIINSLLATSCISFKEFHQHPLTFEQIFIEDSIQWEKPTLDSNNTFFGKENVIGHARIEFGIIQDKMILLVRTHATRTIDDSIHFFSPGSLGGQLIRGTLSDYEIIKSKCEILNNSTFKLKDNKLMINDKIFVKGTNYKPDRIDRILTGLTYYKSRKDTGLTVEFSN